MPPRKSKSTRFAVESSLKNVSLTRAGSSVTLMVYERGAKLGEIHLGRGSIFWWGAGRRKRKRLRWDRVADVLNHLAYGDGDLN
jgi:hypothetical protein